MIDKARLQTVVEKALAEGEYYLVDLSVTPDNVVKVEIDSDKGVDIDYCVGLNRAIEAEFDREVEDYELEVGSAGITSPLKVARQYARNIGKKVEVLGKDGKKHRGELKAYDPETGKIDIIETVKVKKPGAKRPEAVDTTVSFMPEERNAVLPVLEF